MLFRSDARFAPIYVRTFYVPKFGGPWNHRLMARALARPIAEVRRQFEHDVVLGAWVYPDACALDLLSVELAAPLTSTPLAKAEWAQPVVFGKARCVTVRAVRGTAPVFFESAPSAPVCETPVDRFPPPAPTGLVAFPGEGGIGLTWDAVTAADLAGYLVLRGEGADDTLRPITPEPLTATTFTDATARAGVRYTYAVLAVDRATPANRSKESNRVSETGR